MAKLNGTVSVTELPPHRGLILSLCFFRVEGADTPAPYGGDPPAEAVTDCHQIHKQVDLHTESMQAAIELPFTVERPAGFYYLQVRAILFRLLAEKMWAQAEQFFYRRRPLALTEEMPSVTLPVPWPTTSPDEWNVYGVFEPKKPGA
jgi:hypothetical protein